MVALNLPWRVPVDGGDGRMAAPEPALLPQALEAAAQGPGPDTGPDTGPGRGRDDNVRKATPEEVRRVVERAERLYRKPLRAEVVAAAREHRLSLVERAIEVAEEAASYSWRFVEGVLQNWRIRPPQERTRPATVTTPERIDAGVAWWEEWRRQRVEGGAS